MGFAVKSFNITVHLAVCRSSRSHRLPSLKTYLENVCPSVWNKKLKYDRFFPKKCSLYDLIRSCKGLPCFYLCSWNVIIGYTFCVILAKCSLQLMGCVYWNRVNNHGICWLIQLFGVTCMNPVGWNDYTPVCTFALSFRVSFFVWCCKRQLTGSWFFR